MDRTFVGFGFGAIQAGLFIKEAQDCGNFSRIVVAETDSKMVRAIRQMCGVFQLNAANRGGIKTEIISGNEIFNPCDPTDRPAFMDALRHKDPPHLFVIVGEHKGSKNPTPLLPFKAFQPRKRNRFRRVLKRPPLTDAQSRSAK